MIKLFITFASNLLRYCFLKLRYGARYSSHYIERLAFSADVRLFGKGRISIGRNVEIAPGCELLVHGNGHLSVGAAVYMNRYCMVSCHESVRIGANCMFGPGVKIFDNNHRFSKAKGVSTELSTAPISIGDNCWLASDVIVLKGANIGDNCVIGAGCMISGTIPSGSIVRQDAHLIIEPLR